ncbi:MAG: sigma-70 family RNA polymerase sigma factor [Bacteroidetes bacterium]|nr:sigma-70 family RNA polymerase sigma factor [Bacteroidota bacterium]
MQIESLLKDRNLLLQELKSGNQKLLQKLYETHREAFGRWAMKQYKCSDDLAGEAYQKAFIAFYYNVREGKLTELNSSVKTYLFAIGKNVIRDQFKLKQNQTEELDEKIAGSQPDFTIMEKYDNSHAKELVRNLLTQIGEPCKTVLELFYLKQYALESIAEEMGYKSESVVAKRKFICLQQLRKLLLNARSEGAASVQN